MKTVPKNKYMFDITISTPEEFEYGNSPYHVSVNTVKCWEETGYLIDHYTDEERAELNPVFDGLKMYELMESTYECESAPDVLREQLLDAGFVENEAFSKFLEECRESC